MKYACTANIYQTPTFYLTKIQIIADDEKKTVINIKKKQTIN